MRVIETSRPSSRLAPGLPSATITLRPHRLDLPVEEGPAGGGLVGQRRAVLGRPALHDVADVDARCAGCRGPSRSCCVSSSPARPTNGQPAPVLLRARAFADEHQLRSGLPSPNTIGCGPAQSRQRVQSPSASRTAVEGRRARRTATRLARRAGRLLRSGRESALPRARSAARGARRAAPAPSASTPSSCSSSSQPRAAADHAPQLAAQRAVHALRSRARPRRAPRRRVRAGAWVAASARADLSLAGIGLPVPASIVPWRVASIFCLHLELEARVVRVVVAAAADLEDHAGVALVAERQDGAALRRVGGDVVAAGPVARFAADAREVGVRPPALRARREAAGAAEAGRVAAAGSSRRPALPAFAERRDGARRAGSSTRSRTRPRGSSGRPPSRRGAAAVGSRFGARRAALGEDLLALLGRQRQQVRVRRVRDARQEGRVLEAERVLRVVAGERRPSRSRRACTKSGREVRTAAAVAVLAADVLELGAGAWRSRSRPACRSRRRGSSTHSAFESAPWRTSVSKAPAWAVSCQVSCSRLVADAAGLVAADSPSLRSSIGTGMPASLRQAHAQQRLVRLRREALACAPRCGPARRSAPRRARRRRRRRPRGSCRSRRRRTGKKSSPSFLQRLAHRRSVRPVSSTPTSTGRLSSAKSSRAPSSTNSRNSWQCGQVCRKKSSTTGLPALRGEVEGLLAVEHVGGEGRRHRASPTRRSRPARAGAAPRAAAARPSSARLAVAREARHAEDDVALGVDAEQRHRRRAARSCAGDLRARSRRSPGSASPWRATKARALRPARADRDADDLEVVLAALLRDRGQRAARPARSTSTSGLKKKTTTRLPSSDAISRRLSSSVQPPKAGSGRSCAARSAPARRGLRVALCAAASRAAPRARPGAAARLRSSPQPRARQRSSATTRGGAQSRARAHGSTGGAARHAPQHSDVRARRRRAAR